MNDDEKNFKIHENTEVQNLIPHYDSDITKEALTQDIIKLAMDGNEEAFTSVFMASYRYVYSVVRNYLNNDDDIYDAIQETYTKVYANFKKLKEPKSFLPWIGKISENVSKDILSCKSKINLTSAEEEEFLHEKGSDQLDVSVSSDVSIDITEVFSQLSPEDAELLTFVYYDGFKVSDIARMQGIAKTTVYSRLNAAKNRLKNLLKVHGIEKPLYGGDLITLIATTIRNSIGTNVLSAAVAEEILQSVTGKNTKAGVVISKVAKSQRNTAVLRIASLIVLIAVLATAITVGGYVGIKSLFNKNNTPNNSSGSMILGNSSSESENDNNGANNSSPTASMQPLDTHTPELLPIFSSAPSQVIPTIPGTVSQTPVLTEAPSASIFPPYNTNAQIPGIPTQIVIPNIQPSVTNGNNISISTPLVTGGNSIYTTPPKPTKNYISTPTPSKVTTRPTVNVTVAPTISTPEVSAPTNAPQTTPQHVSSASTTLLYQNGPTISNGYIYFVKWLENSSGLQYGIFKAKLDGSGWSQVREYRYGEINNLQVAGDYLFFLNSGRLHRITLSTGYEEKISSLQYINKFNIINNILYAEQITDGRTNYYETPIDNIDLLPTDKKYGSYTFSSDGTKAYYRHITYPDYINSIYEYDMETNEEKLLVENCLLADLCFVCNEYFVYSYVDGYGNRRYRLSSLSNPSNIIADYDYNFCSYFSAYKGGVLGLSNTYGEKFVHYISDPFVPHYVDWRLPANVHTFPNDDYIYYIDINNEKLHKALPDGSDIICLEQ